MRNRPRNNIDDRNSVRVTERKAFSVEIFATRNGISRSQSFKEIAAGRLIARKVGSRTIITEEAEKAWQDALPRAVPQVSSVRAKKRAATAELHATTAE